MFCIHCGKEIDDLAAVCVHCGRSTQGARVAKDDAPSFAMALMCFLIPLVGLIVWGIYRESRPLMAKSALKGGVIGFFVWLAVGLLIVVGYFLLLGALFSDFYYYY